MFIKPMLADKLSEKKRPTITFESGYLLEAKHDGVRAIVSKDSSGVVEIYTRVGNTLAASLPQLVEEFKKLPNDTILDGELMVEKAWVNIPGGNMVPIPDFNATMRIIGSKPEVAIQKQEDYTMNFHAFDILRYNGHDWIDYPYQARAKQLREFIPEHDMTFVSVPSDWGYWDSTTLDDLLRAGLEGAILKNKDSLYLVGKRRANTWYKIKAELTADVVVTGFTDAQHGVTGKFDGLIGAIKFGAYNVAGDLVEIGQCSGMTDEVRAGWTAVRDFMPEGEIPVNPKTGKQYVIEIKYNDLLATGTPRHPQYRTERLDKKPEDCTFEQFSVEAYRG